MIVAISVEEPPTSTVDGMATTVTE